MMIHAEMIKSLPENTVHLDQFFEYNKERMRD